MSRREKTKKIEARDVPAVGVGVVASDRSSRRPLACLLACPFARSSGSEPGSLRAAGCTSAWCRPLEEVIQQRVVRCDNILHSQPVSRLAGSLDDWLDSMTY